MNEDRLILINLPENYENTTIDYPVLYLFYGDRVMQYFSPVVTDIYNLSQDGFIPQMIVVGIGNTDRYRDLLLFDRNGPNKKSEKFIDFLQKELFQYIESNYRVKKSRIFVAPQASAEFCLNAAFLYPEIYKTCFMNNPFRWPYSRKYLLDKTEEYLEKGMSSKIFIYSSFNSIDFFDTEDSIYIKKWEEIINSAKQKDFNAVINYDEVNQDFVSPLELKKGLKLYFKNYRFPEKLEVDNLSVIRNFYSSLAPEYGFIPDEPDIILTQKSDELMQNGEIAKSKEILEYLLSKYPKSGNALWRLGNIYREEADTAKALEYYKKLIEVYPDMTPAKRFIDKLEKKK